MNRSLICALLCALSIIAFAAGDPDIFRDHVPAPISFDMTMAGERISIGQANMSVKDCEGLYNFPVDDYGYQIWNNRNPDGDYVIGKTNPNQDKPTYLVTSRGWFNNNWKWADDLCIRYDK